MANILIVDDNKSLGALLKKELELEDHRVLISASNLLSIMHSSDLFVDLVLINQINQNNSGWVIFNQFKRMNADIPALLYVSGSYGRTNITWIIKAVREALICINNAMQKNSIHSSGKRPFDSVEDVRQDGKEI